MDRRAFLKTGAALSATSLAPWAIAQESGWRTFEVTHRVELISNSQARVWLPVPSINGAYQKVTSNVFKSGGKNARIVQDGKYGASILHAEFLPGESPVVELTSRFSTRDHAVALSGASPSQSSLSRAERRLYLAATELIPTDGIVKDTAMDVVRGHKTDVERARAIYEWIVDNTYRDAKTRGCGVGDVKFMLETKNLSGKCADLNALFVGLARAAGIPARDVYGIRVADSRLGYKSLGKSGDVTRGQHCRAEFWADGAGWVPVDPADVRKVVLEENGGLPLGDAKVEAARKRLFGSWEMNWLAYNYAHDVKLPGSDKAPIGFFMYPNGESVEAGRTFRLDSLDPEGFTYRITSRELTV